MKRFIQLKIKFLFFLIIIILNFSQAFNYAQTDPDFEWIISLGGNLTDDINDIITDADGNIIVTGSFDTFMSIGTFNLNSFGGSDFFLAKFDTDGNVIWATNAGSNTYDVGHSVAIDNNGDIIVTGIYNGDATFGSIVLPLRGGYDIFIAKYSSSGNLLWAERAGGQGFDFAEQIDTDELNNIYFTGVYEGTAFFDTIAVSGGQFPNVYLAKYNSAGRVQWVRTGISSSFSVGSYGLATSGNNEIYITGSFESSINFSGILLTGQLGRDIFLTKYNSDGTVLWAIQAGGLSFNDEGRDIYVDKDNNVFVTGSFGQTVTFGSFTLTSTASDDIFVAKYTPSGDPIWVTQDNGFPDNFNSGAGIHADDAGNVSVISEVPQTIGSTGEVNDLYISRYNKDGQKIWGFVCGSQSSDYAGKIAIDNNGDIITAGSYYENGIFNSHILNSNGFHDAFLGKIPAPRFFVEDNTIDFGNVAIGGTGNINLTIHNTANTTLHFYNILIGGNDASVFSINPSPVSIDPLDSQTVSLGFSPLTSGIKSAHILFETDSPFSPDTVFLSGSAGVVTILLSTSLLDFGSVDTSDTAERTVTVTNNGLEPAAILLPLIIGLNQSDFSVNNISSFPDTLQPQEVKNIIIRFSPNSTGNRSAQLQILSNAPSSPDIVELQGTGIGALIEITLSTNLLNFGTVDIDNSTERPLIITNTGTQNVTIDSASIVPAGQTDFSLSNPGFPILLLPEESINISLSFSPTSEGSKSAQLQIVSNALSSPEIVDLQGIAVIGINVERPTSALLGQSIALNISPPAGFVVTAGEIFYRQTGEQIYTRTMLTQQDTSFPAEIPPQFSTIKGIQFYIVFTGATGSVTYPTTNPINQPAFLQVNVPVFPFQGTIPNAEYRMVSIPLTVNNPDILSVFGDDYGQYDSTMWRIFRWNNILDAYDEFPESDLTPGNAFWLIHREGKTFDIENAMSVQSSNDFIITLQANSWTQIGNPFAFEVDFNPGLEIDSLYLYRWNIDSLEYEMNQTILEPWDGYFVRNDNDIPVILSIPPIRSIIEKQIPKIVTFSGGEFVVQIKTNVEGSRYKDNQNYVGMINDKKNIYAANLLEPPPITNDIRLSIVEDNKYFAQNTISVNSDGSSWNLQLSTSHRNKNIQFNFDYLNTLPAGFNIYLLNVDRQVAIPIHNNSADIKITNDDKISLKLIIGTEQFAKNNSQNISLTPTEYMLSQNYPNPFNPTTSIVYNLREKSVVTIEVFDILGRKIRSLISEEQQNSGLHTVVWNGINSYGEFVSSGIYIYRIRANDFIDNKKMMLLK